MGLNETPSAERVHIGFFGRRNAGKSSILNAVTGQDLAVVSDIPGTTTDPVSKAMEILPLGPVVVIDTAGFDDEGELGELRIKKTRQTLNRVDVAVLIVDATAGLSDTDEKLMSLFAEKNIPWIVAWNKADLLKPGKGTAGYALDAGDTGIDSYEVLKASKQTSFGDGHSYTEIYVSAKDNFNIYELKEEIAKAGKISENSRKLVGDLINSGDLVILVIPIDESAPKGRLILPQQMMIRDILDHGGMALCVKETELAAAISALDGTDKKISLVITDSQAFEYVAAIVPRDIRLTSFSILMARYKGLLEDSLKGVRAVENLQDGDKILISEGCTHHRQCGDIGTVKIPGWLKKHTGKDLVIETSSGTGFPEDLSGYAMVIHCGGCMLNEREMRYRMKCAKDQNIPMTNYGLVIAYMKGILERSVDIGINL